MDVGRYPCRHDANMPGRDSERALQPPDGPQPALAVSGLCFSYPDRRDAIKDVSLEVMPGEKVGLVGPNGSGKTTLFLNICGILKPSAGEIVLLGKTVTDGGFRSEVGFVFQNPDDQLFCPSVRDDVAFGPQNMGLSRDEVETRVNEALSVVGAVELADRSPHHLSGGEKRMVSIAGVLAMRPRFIMYDEPSANLDIRSRRTLISLLQSSTKTMLVASHDLELILEICRRVVLLDGGRIVADGDAREIMLDDKLMEAHGQERPHSLRLHVISHHQTG